MKKVLLTLMAVACAASVLAQGTVLYYNQGSGLLSRIYGPETPDNTVSKTGNTSAGIPAGTQVYTGAPLNGAGFRAQLFGANGTGQAESALTAATTVNTFRTGGAAGYLATTTATIMSVAPDAPQGATLQLRAWDNTSGLYADYAAADGAWRQGLIAAGRSAVFDQAIGTMGGGIGAAGLPANLRSFNIYYLVPEPSSFALAGLGAAAMLIFRRRK